MRRRTDPHIRLVVSLCALIACFPGTGQATSDPPVVPIFAVGGDGPSSPFHNAQGVFYDQRYHEIYIADTGNHRIVVLDRDGYPRHSLSHYVTRGGKRIPGEPRSVAVDSKGHIFVVDALSPDVDILDPQGIVLGRIVPSEILPGAPPLRAEIITVDKVDRIYVGVSGHFGGVLVLDSGLNLTATYPPVDSEDQTEYLTGLWVNPEGSVCVTDPSGVPAVRVFESDGTMRLAFGKHDVGYNNFSRPSGVLVDEEGRLWVADMLRQVVKAFDPEGRYLTYLGGRGGGPGTLDYPSAVTTDGKKRLYVLNRRVGGLVCFEISSGGALAMAGNPDRNP